MCGVFGFTGKSYDQMAELKTMAAQQLHRGPDGEGYYTGPGIAIGMRRLSIIDLEHGQQPFYGRDGSVVAVCNGEIYNYIELRDDLKALGYSFKTSSDVEVIPHLYEEYGPDFVKKLNGMFAIALYDEKKRALVLIRDRLGIKPVYYSLKNGEIAFASELRSILAVGKADNTLDHESLSAYLDMLYIPCPGTPFKSIRKLESGSMLVFSSKGASVTRYWEPSVKKPSIRSEQEAVEMTESLLKDSIRLELRSDVPVGALLSGGVDSSCVTALASLQARERLKTFHAQWSGASEKVDESPYARKVAELYKTEHHVREISEDELISLLPKLVWHLEEPLADGAFVPTFALSKLASESVKVVLTGAGGDEMFGGYHHHRKISLLKAAIKKLIYGNDEKGSYYDKWQPLRRNDWHETFGWYQKDAYRAKIDSIFKKYRNVDELNATMLTDMLVYLQDDILLLTDKMTMAASLECRVPILDHRMAELSTTIDSGLKIRGGEKKYILKKLMEKYVPADVLYRKKEGFGAPVVTWVNKYKAKYFDDVMRSGVLSKDAASARKKIGTLCSKPVLDSEESWEYWKLLLLEIWFRIFVYGQAYGTIFT